MKKFLLCGAIMLLLGCASAPQATKEEPAVQEDIPVVIPSCCQQGGCYSAPQPMVLKPRVIDILRPNNRKRRCCPDGEPVLPGQEGIVYVPDAPEIYVIAANRAVNYMQKEAEPFFKQIGTMKVFVDKANLKSDDLPGGTDKGTQTLKTRFNNISNVIVVNTINEADFVVNSVIDWYDTPTKIVPAIKYDMFLNAKDGHVIGEWSEIIHQTQGDRSWW